MARYNEILVGRFNLALNRLLGMKAGPPSPQLSGEINTSINIDQMEADVLWNLGWNIFAFNIGVTGGAAQTAGIQMRNPPNSNVIALIDSSRVANGTGQDQGNLSWQFSGAQPADLGTSATAVTMGPPFSTPSNMIISTSVNVAADLAGIAAFYDVNAAHVVQEQLTVPRSQLTLFPGQTLLWRSHLVNSLLLVGCRWRERFLDEGERR